MRVVPEVMRPRFHVDQYVNGKDAAWLMGCSKQTLWRLVRQRKIRHFKTDFGPRYKVRDLHDYMVKRVA